MTPRLETPTVVLSTIVGSAIIAFLAYSAMKPDRWAIPNQLWSF
ncbi:hypothetical protein [Rhodococcus sp. NPDC055024]